MNEQPFADPANPPKPDLTSREKLTKQIEESAAARSEVREIGRICRERKLWLHVDSAMSGTAALCPEFRFINDGVELADSYTFNPHKWMFTNFDCNVFYVAERKHLIGDAVDSAGVSTQSGDGIGGGDRLSRLAHPIGAAVSVLAQALVCDPALWN